MYVIDQCTKCPSWLFKHNALQNSSNLKLFSIDQILCTILGQCTHYFLFHGKVDKITDNKFINNIVVVWS